MNYGRFMKKPLDVFTKAELSKFSQEELIDLVVSLQKQFEVVDYKNNQISLALENVAASIWEWDLKKKQIKYLSFPYFTQQEYQSQESLDEYQWFQLLHPEDREKEQLILKEYLENITDFYETEFRMLGSDGNYHWYWSNGKVVKRNDKGNAILLSGIQIDVGKRKEIEKATKSYYYDLEKLIEGRAGKLEISKRKIDEANKELKEINASLKKEIEKRNEVEEELAANEAILRKQVLRLQAIREELEDKQQRLKESNSRFQLVNEAFEEGLWEVSIPKNNKLTESSPLWIAPKVFELLGYGYDELPHTFGTFIKIIHPSQRSFISKKYRDFITGKLENDRYDIEMQLQNKGGEYVWFQAKSKLIRDKDEKPLKEVGAIVDIDKRKHADKALAEAFETLQASEEELRQQSEELQSLNENLEVIKSQLESSLEKETLANQKIERKNLALYNQKKELKKTIDALKKAQEKLLQTEKLASLGVLVAGVAHEVNNPVNYISSSCEGLKIMIQDISNLLILFEKIDTDNFREKLKEINQLKTEIGYEELLADMQEMITNISSGAEQTAEIVRGLRTFSRIDTGNLESADIHQHINAALIMLYSQYKDSIQIIKSYGVLPNVQCFPSKINQVLVNMISNAIYAIFEKDIQKNEKIIITTSYTELKKDSFISIIIEDTGIGIKGELMKNIFDPFFTTKQVGKGTGLGLSISLGIIEDHQGTIQVKSEYGKGTKVYVSLPVKQN